jgi:FSR family fosmidomycin resistance protein-like MFS transporter
MSWFTVGGVVGFALAPVLTTAIVLAWGIKGVLLLLLPSGLIATLLAQLTSATARSPLTQRPEQQVHTLRDNWRGFATLSGATICRSIAFFGLNTFLALYFMNRWGQSAAEGNRALALFLSTSIAGTLAGGLLADRFGRRAVLRAGFVGSAMFLTLFVLTANQTVALMLLVPLALCIFLPSSVQVVLGQEYLPSRVGMASGVTLGLAVSVGGMAAPLLGRLADWMGLGAVFLALIAVVLMALILSIALPSTMNRVDTRQLTTMIHPTDCRGSEPGV